MKVLLDQNVFTEIAEILREKGFEVQHTRDLGLARAADATILEHAAQHGWIVVTHDEDFHMLLAAEGAACPSVVRLRLMLAPAALAERIAETLHRFESALRAGAAVTVTARGARAHRLPFR